MLWGSLGAPQSDPNPALTVLYITPLFLSAATPWCSFIFIGRQPLSPSVPSLVLWLISRDHWALCPLAKIMQFFMNVSHTLVDLLVPIWHCVPVATTYGPNAPYLSFRAFNCGLLTPYSHIQALQMLLCQQFSSCIEASALLTWALLFSGCRPPALAQWFGPSCLGLSPLGVWSLGPLALSYALSLSPWHPWPRARLILVRLSPLASLTQDEAAPGSAQPHWQPDPGQGCSWFRALQHLCGLQSSPFSHTQSSGLKLEWKNTSSHYKLKISSSGLSYSCQATFSFSGSLCLGSSCHGLQRPLLISLSWQELPSQQGSRLHCPPAAETQVHVPRAPPPGQVFFWPDVGVFLHLNGHLTASSLLQLTPVEVPGALSAAVSPLT